MDATDDAASTSTTAAADAAFDALDPQVRLVPSTSFQCIAAVQRFKMSDVQAPSAPSASPRTLTLRAAISCLLGFILGIAVVLLLLYLRRSLSQGFAASTESSVSSPVADERPAELLRLSKSVWPQHYRLTMRPNLPPHGDPASNDKFKLAGIADIDLFVESGVDELRLHARRLIVAERDIRLSNATHASIAIEWLEHLEAYDLLRIRLSTPLAANGTYRLVVPYLGQLDDSDGKIGFYSGTYLVDGEGGSRYRRRRFAITKFEPTYARRAFPCFDEPAHKATIAVDVYARRPYHVLSNMPVDFVEDIPSGGGLLARHIEWWPAVNGVRAIEDVGGEWRVFSFLKTPIMPIYTFALLISDMVNVSDVGYDGTPVSEESTN